MIIICNDIINLNELQKDKRTNKPKIWIYRDKESGKGKGECTITYDDPAAASGAIQWFDGKDFNGNVIKVQLAQRNNTWQKGGGGGSSMGGGGGLKKPFGSGGGGNNIQLFLNILICN